MKGGGKPVAPASSAPKGGSDRFKSFVKRGKDGGGKGKGGKMP